MRRFVGHYAGDGEMVDWTKVRRVNHGMTEEEKDEVIKKLNEYVNQYSSSESVYYNEDEDGWDYRPEEDQE